MYESWHRGACSKNKKEVEGDEVDKDDVKAETVGQVMEKAREFKLHKLKLKNHSPIV